MGSERKITAPSDTAEDSVQKIRALHGYLLESFFYYMLDMQLLLSNRIALLM